MGNCFNKAGSPKIKSQEREALYEIQNMAPIVDESTVVEDYMDPEIKKLSKPMPSKPGSKEDPIVYATWKANCMN